jgi:hypothetical protein
MKAENPFTSKLYHHTLPVREEVWESIEKRLPPKEEQRFPFFWFMLFASTLISGALMFGILNKKTPVSSTPAKSPSYTSSHTKTVNPSETPDLHINDANQNQTTTPQEDPVTSSSDVHKSSMASASLSSSTPSATKSNKANHPQQNQSSIGTNSNSKAYPLLPGFEQSMESEAITSSAASAASASSASSASSFHSTASTSLLPLVDVEELNNPGNDLIGIRKSKPDPNCYKFSGIGGKYYFSVDAFAGPGFSPRSFTAVDSESSSYTQARETTESKQYAWSAGARLNLNLRSGLAFRLGLLYDQAGDVFDYTDTLATHSTFRIDSFFAADGTFLYSDSSRVLLLGTLIKKIHNTYRHLDVPILVSYEMPLGRSSSIMFNVGPVFNLSTSYEGQILDPMLHPRTITPGSPNELYVYKTNVGISLYFGAGVVFPITDKISGLVEPRYLYRIKPVTIDSYPLEEHRHFAGLNLGLRYFLD